MKTDGAKTHPCVTVEFTGKKPETPLPHFTALIPKVKSSHHFNNPCIYPKDSQNIPECLTMHQPNAFSRLT